MGTDYILVFQKKDIYYYVNFLKQLSPYVNLNYFWKDYLSDNTEKWIELPKMIDKWQELRNIIEKVVIKKMNDIKNVIAYCPTNYNELQDIYDEYFDGELEDYMGEFIILGKIDMIIDILDDITWHIEDEKVKLEISY